MHKIIKPAVLKIIMIGLLSSPSYGIHTYVSNIWSDFKNNLQSSVVVNYTSQTLTPNFEPSPWIEDSQLCEMNQKGIQSQAYQPGKYGNLETSLVHYQKFYLNHLQDYINDLI